MSVLSLIFVLLLPFSTPAQKPVNSCGCEGKPLPEVVATVNGAKITKAELNQTTAAGVEKLQLEVVAARKNELDLQINSILLAAEAKKRGVTSKKLLEMEVVSKTREPTEAEALAFYEKNRSKLQRDFPSLKDDILDHLSEQSEQDLAKAFAARLRSAAQVTVITPSVAPADTPAERARVMAIVNRQKITAGDVEDGLRPLIFKVQQQVYDLHMTGLETRINVALLTLEAQKQKTTTVALIEKEVTAKIPAVTEREALMFFNQNKSRIKGEFPQVKAQIISYIKERAQQDLSLTYATELRRNAAIQIFITPPEPPIYDIATDDQPVKGNPKARVTLVEFTDFQCPACAQQHPILEQLIGEYGDRLKLVVRDYPLGQHENAAQAAEAAEAAREQGKYWEYVALLFTRQSSLQLERLKEYATEVGLDRVKFDAALASGKFADKIQRDMSDGQKVGVNGTPTIFLNGRRIDITTYEALKAAIEETLKNTR